MYIAMLMGKAVFKCPKTDRDVTLHQDCINCNDFGYWGIKGARPYISCKAEKVG